MLNIQVSLLIFNINISPTLNDMESLFQLSQPEESFSRIKSTGTPESYLEELFLIGKMTEDDSLRAEILEIITSISDASVVKAFKSRSKIANTGTAKDYVSRINALVSFAKITTTLDIGKLFSLLSNSPEHSTLMVQEKSPLDKNPEMLGRFNGISELIIWNAFGSEVPKELGELTSLEKLEIHSHKITQLPPIGKLGLLKELDLHTSTLVELPDSLQLISSLEKLSIDVGYNSQSTAQIPEWIGQLQNLKELKLCYLNMESLPETVFPQSLEDLYLAQLKELKAVPASLAHCKKLKRLCFATSDKIQALPEGLQNLSELEELEISNMKGLSHVSGELLFSPQLKKLSISGLTAPITEPEPRINRRKELYIANTQYLSYFLKNTSLFPELESLKISLDTNSKFPEGSLEHLKKLKQVDFLYGVSDSVLESLSKCHSLEIFNIYNVSNSLFPDLSGLSKLQSIYTHYCQQLEVSFSKLPAQLNKLELKFAKCLDFDAAKSIQIGTCILEGTSLIHFDAIGNYAFKHLSIYINTISTIDGKKTIPSLPKSIAQLNDLESFSFNGAIDDIPDCFSSLPMLKKLKITGYNFSDGKHSIRSVSDKIFSGKSLRSCHLENYTGDVHPILLSARKAEEIYLDSIPTLKHLPDLSMLVDLKNIEIRNCDEFIFLKNTPLQISSITLYRCRSVSAELYQEITSMKNLREVRLSFLSKALNRFPQEWNFLEMLELDSLDIREVPATIASFSKLKRLVVDRLILRTLPDELAELKQLKQLGIKGTYLTELPPSLMALELDEVRMWFSKFAGNNIKREVYCVLINENTKIVSEFGGEEYFWPKYEALEQRKSMVRK